MASNLSNPEQLVDMTFVGRRAHDCETRKYLAIAKAGAKSTQLERGEGDPIGLMSADSARVSIVMAARNGKVLGVPGAQDEWWRRAAAAETTQNVVG